MNKMVYEPSYAMLNYDVRFGNSICNSLTLMDLEQQIYRQVFDTVQILTRKILLNQFLTESELL